ncbi:cobalt ECF transporter T component CbiQ [Halodesulfovibrio marinisediminis]|uniref:Cobalt/nickel transport system permease protein n=1 Tax=Halodesulfovibrio marinisediminis DSM 17456 TaxID=1121457 RepID=A0A1N6IBW9_9BACT|nr:cobalt ECF transporter T component CbiQ [Halodesulfovibrio marinisediminis]SIO29514.1 cobalt/nickel transport system permease protein [Halodesulfovibrio marinisediminis DSM 17456]
MALESFAEGTSPFHSMDAAAKITAATFFSICTALLTTIPTACAALIVGIALLCIAQLPVKTLCRRLLFINAFIAFLWLTLPVSTTGTPIYSWGGFTITKEGVDLTLLITLKSNAIITAFIALLATSNITDIGAGFAKLRVPQKLSLLFLFTWRYIHVIQEEYKRLSTAATLRGFVPTTNSHTYKTYANLIAMVLVKSHDRAERVSNAMKLRGFNGTFHSLHSTQKTSTDTAVTACIILIGTALLAADFFHLTELL